MYLISGVGTSHDKEKECRITERILEMCKIFKVISNIESNMIACCVAKKNASHCVYIDRRDFHTCMAPWSLTPFLHYGCLPGRVDHTANLIKYTPAIHEI